MIPHAWLAYPPQKWRDNVEKTSGGVDSSGNGVFMHLCVLTAGFGLELQWHSWPSIEFLAG